MYADDFVDIYVDGKLVAENNSTVTNVDNVWTGILKEDSEIEIRLVDMTGGARVILDMIKVTQLGDEQIELFTSPSVDDFYVCTGGTEYPIVVREEGYTWNVTDGTNNIDRFSANGDTAYCISPASGNVSPSYSVSLSWDDTERQSGINDLSSLEMSYQDGTEWLKLEATPLAGATINAGSLQNEASNLLTVSGPVTFGSTEESDILNPLPVSFVRFQAELINDIPSLTWVTTSERNNDYYIIERSDDAISFDSIAYVDGSGTSYQTNYYHFDDDTYEQGSTCYYRIRQKDFDGSSTVSQMVSVSANLRTVTDESANIIEVFPNPLTGV